MKFPRQTISDAAAMGHIETIRDSLVESVKAHGSVVVVNELGEAVSKPLDSVLAVDLYLEQFGLKDPFWGSAPLKHLQRFNAECPAASKDAQGLKLAFQEWVAKQTPQVQAECQMALALMPTSKSA